MHELLVGSSPRARGTRIDEHHDLRVVRFIPAGAGNTRPAAGSTPRTAVHPRGRGEHIFSAERPPKTIRFIPAGAGNTDRMGIATILQTVHPRGRGEHVLPTVNIISICGSSPRARGTLRVAALERDFGRFIPAGAGNTLSPGDSATVLAVHPRGRGEHFGAGNTHGEPIGSSPRARGTPQAAGHCWA